MFRIELTPEAADDLGSMRTFDARRVVAAMESQLTHEPTRETRNRKQLRPNELAEWELRVDVFFGSLTTSQMRLSTLSPSG
jgi:hypothetical protein